jgi:hypothetical protein
MNKYQIQALVDMGKIAVAIFAFIAIFNAIIAFELMTVPNLFGSISLIACFYCIYQLYLIRVGQLESQDKETN